MTSRKDQEQYWAHKDDPYNFVTVKEFAEAFQSFHVGRKIGDELATPFDKAKSHPAALTTRKYGIKKEELLKTCLSREFLLMKRNSFVYIFKFIQVSLTLFYFLFFKNYFLYQISLCMNMIPRYFFCFFFSDFSLR